MRVRGYVKWFDATKGYGFVVGEDEGGDILLHSNVLRLFGYSSVAEGAVIVVEAQTTERGRQAVEVIDIEAAPQPPGGVVATFMPATRIAEEGPLEPARVKWFDRVKGFGFVNVYGRLEDVFLHMETLRQYGYGEVTGGDVLAVRITRGPRGPMVYEVRSWDYVARKRLEGESLD
jgi:CspA family cold shock protein